MPRKEPELPLAPFERTGKVKVSVVAGLMVKLYEYRNPDECVAWMSC